MEVARRGGGGRRRQSPRLVVEQETAEGQAVSGRGAGRLDKAENGRSGQNDGRASGGNGTLEKGAHQASRGGDGRGFATLPRPVSRRGTPGSSACTRFDGVPRSRRSDGPEPVDYHRAEAGPTA